MARPNPPSVLIPTADAKLANAVGDERARSSALKVRLEEAEEATRRAVAAGREAAEREERGRLAATELAELVRQQKVPTAPLYMTMHNTSG